LVSLFGICLLDLVEINGLILYVRQLIVAHMLSDTFLGVEWVWVIFSSRVV